MPAPHREVFYSTLSSYANLWHKYLDYDQMRLSEYSSALIQLSQSVGQSSFYSNLKAYLQQILSFDEMLVLLFSKQQHTQLLFRFGNEPEHYNNLQGEDAWKYLSRLYVLDPFYRLYADKQQYGYFWLEDVAPEEFATIYNQYFNYLELADEVGYLIELPEGNCLHLDLSRFGKSEKFSDEDKQLLTELFSVVADLMLQHQAQIKQPEIDSSNFTGCTLENFGRDVFTPKEYQVSQLLLQGHSTLAIGNILKIGKETVKMHKKNIYGKTFISSQSELLALFIDIVTQEQLDQNGDQLKLYLDAS